MNLEYLGLLSGFRTMEEGFFFFFFDRNFAAAKTIKLVKTGFVPGKVFWLRIVFIFVRFVVELNVKAWKLG